MTLRETNPFDCKVAETPIFSMHRHHRRKPNDPRHRLAADQGKSLGRVHRHLQGQCTECAAGKRLHRIRPDHRRADRSAASGKTPQRRDNRRKMGNPRRSDGPHEGTAHAHLRREGQGHGREEITAVYLGR